ncbi:GSCOCG00001005001-RA-CDS [Cotesia congregata]|nr:GSCOCG00001005001-RA-CDS [Cotesia congregata]
MFCKKLMSRLFLMNGVRGGSELPDEEKQSMMFSCALVTKKVAEILVKVTQVVL